MYKQYSKKKINNSNWNYSGLIAFLDLHLSISNDIVSTKIYDKRDDFDFEIVNFPFLDGDVPRSTSYGVYISHLIRFARASSFLNKAISIINFAKHFQNYVSECSQTNHKEETQNTNINMISIRHLK